MMTSPENDVLITIVNSQLQMNKFVEPAQTISFMALGNSLNLSSDNR